MELTAHRCPTNPVQQAASQTEAWPQQGKPWDVLAEAGKAIERAETKQTHGSLDQHVFGD